MDQASREAANLPALAESSERSPDASFEADADLGAVEDSNAADVSQPAAGDGADSQSNALTLLDASRNDDFVVVGLDSTLEQFHRDCEYLPEPGLAERPLGTTDAATQSDGDTEKFGKALEDSNRRIEELERRIRMQQAEIARVEQEMAACRRECADQISSMRQCLDSKISEVSLSESQNNEATDLKPICSLHVNQSEERVQSDGLESASLERENTAHSGAERVSALLLSPDTVGSEEGAGVQIRKEVAAYRQECVNQMISLRQRLEASCFELRLQCSAYVTALERRLTETMSAEHETMRSCVTEMSLLRDYVTSMTDVIETIVSIYEPTSDSTRPDSRKVSKPDTAK